MSLEANIAAGKAAATIRDLILDETTRHENGLLLRRLAEILPEGLCSEPVILRDPPMSDEDARRFELEAMPFGAWQFTPIGQVPVDYLLWLETQPDFRRKLNRYLRSCRGQQIQGEA